MINIDLLLSWGATYKKVNRHEVIFHEGTPANFYYQLVSGKVAWVNINDEGREFIQLMVEPSESFGEMPLFDDCPYAATAIAEEDSLLIRLHKSNFLQLLKDNFDIHLAFSKLLSQRLRYKFRTIRELAHYDPEHQIASLLNFFKESNRHTCPTCHQVRLTRKQIAGMTGLRIETVIRAMRNLHEKGEVTIDKGKVYC